MSQDDIHHLYAFFQKEGQKLQQYVLRKSKRINDMDAEDIVDEVMLQLLSIIGMRGPVKNLPAYVYRALQNRMVDTLEPKQRAVFIATEFDGKSFKELSELWHEPIGTLLSRKSRAMKALQTKLKDLDPR